MTKKKKSKQSKKTKKEPSLQKRLKKILTPEQRDRLITALSKPKIPDNNSRSSGTLADSYYDSWRSRPYTGGINDS